MNDVRSSAVLNQAAEKRALRLRCAALRDDVAADERARAAERVAGFAADLAPDGLHVVSAYWPMRSELDPRPLLAALADAGHGVALPICRKGEPLSFRRWTAGDPLLRGPLGTRQPVPESDVVVPTIVLVPLLAFTRAGDRLGYGGGYYDRTLHALRQAGHALSAIGFGYAAQEIQRLPVEAHDARLDGVMTEVGLIRCCASAGGSTCA